MPARRIYERREWLAFDARLHARWEVEREVVRFAVTLLVFDAGAWQTVELFDCSHEGRNDRHRYSYGGAKGAAVTFHQGMPSEAMNDAIDLIKADYEGMIERWRR